MIKGISFDFWGTLFDGNKNIDNYRLTIISNFVKTYGTKSFDQDQVNKVFKSQREIAREKWQRENAHTSTKSIIDKVLEICSVPVEDTKISNEISLLIKNVEEGVYIFPPTIYPDVRESLKFLSSQYSIGIISDTGLTPGSVIRKILDTENLLLLFSSFMFSNEVNYTKPNPQMFRQTATQMNLSNENLLHVGDDVDKDYNGALASGCRGILINRAFRTGQLAENINEEHVISSLFELTSNEKRILSISE